MKPTDTEILAAIREVVEEYDTKAMGMIPTRVLVDMLAGER